MAAEEKGVEVEILRLHDLKIKPCTGCTTCVQGKRRPHFRGLGRVCHQE